MARVTTRRIDELAGLTPGHCSQLENGMLTPRVAAQTLHGLARAFGVSPYWILEGSGDRPDVEKVRASIEAASALVPVKTG